MPLTDTQAAYFAEVLKAILAGKRLIEAIQEPKNAALMNEAASQTTS
jgi:hypothetical protein